jgi:disulfide bond formation protein DsbB
VTLKHLSTILLVLPSALLLGALGFQYIGGLAPCELCIDQRWPHLFAAIMGLAALSLLRKAGLAKVAISLGAIGMATSGAIAVFHSGIERKLWPGPSSCSNRIDPTLSPEEYLKAIEQAAVINCGEITWSLFGLSMANYNALISLGAAAFILWALMGGKLRD